MKQPGADIVVVNYRTSGDLDRFLGSLVEHPPTRPHDVWIVNVCPGADDYEVASRWMKRPKSRELQGAPSGQWHEVVWEDNVGYNRAANHAGAMGSREIVAVFNADTELSADAIDNVCNELLRHDDWAIAGPRQVDDAGKFTAAGIFGTPKEPRHRGWHEPSADGRYSDVRDDCTTVSGAAIFIKRTVWDELRDCVVQQAMFRNSLGPFGEQLHFYGETTSCYHARGHRYRLGYVGTTTMVHTHMGAGRTPPNLAEDRETFRAFCEAHNLEHD